MLFCPYCLYPIQNDIALFNFGGTKTGDRRRKCCHGNLHETVSVCLREATALTGERALSVSIVKGQGYHKLGANEAFHETVSGSVVEELDIGEGLGAVEVMLSKRCRYELRPTWKGAYSVQSAIIYKHKFVEMFLHLLRHASGILMMSDIARSYVAGQATAGLQRCQNDLKECSMRPSLLLPDRINRQWLIVFYILLPLSEPEYLVSVEESTNTEPKSWSGSSWSEKSGCLTGIKDMSDAPRESTYAETPLPKNTGFRIPDHE